MLTKHLHAGSICRHTNCESYETSTVLVDGVAVSHSFYTALVKPSNTIAVALLEDTIQSIIFEQVSLDDISSYRGVSILVVKLSKDR